MAMKWFRFYHEALDDPKVQMLPPDLFKHWVNLLCLACRNDGRLPPLHVTLFSLRIEESVAISVLDRLLDLGLIVKHKGGANGSYIAPYNWDKRQYKSDTSSERVKRYRDKNVTANETPPDTETETETEFNVFSNENTKRARAKTLMKPDDVSESVWRDFCAHRKRKKADITETALKRIRSEAIKAGIGLEEALTECVARGWQGFRASWYLEGGKSDRASDNRDGFDRALDRASGSVRPAEQTGRSGVRGSQGDYLLPPPAA